MVEAVTAVMTESDGLGNLETWSHALRLVCKLTVELPVRGFTVAGMFRLQRGAVIAAHWRVGADVPLRLNGTLLAHGEFEVAGEQLAIRLTELV